MEVTWYGHACFRLRGQPGIVVTDPYDKSLGLTLPALKADIVTISHDAPHHNNVAAIKGNPHVVNSPGEYEINDIFVTGLHMPATKKNSADTTKNNIFVIYMEDLTLCHLGDLNHIPTQSQVEDLDSIDVLMVPVGGQNALNAAQAAEVISLIEPYLVIPMHYGLPSLTVQFDPVSKFLKEMGISKEETVESLKVTKSGLPEETQIVLLEPKL